MFSPNVIYYKIFDFWFQAKTYSPTYYSAQQFLAGKYHMEQTGDVCHIGMNPNVLPSETNEEAVPPVTLQCAVHMHYFLHVLKHLCIYFYFALEIFSVI